MVSLGYVVNWLQQPTPSFFRRGIREEDGFARGGVGTRSGRPALGPASCLGGRDPAVRIGIHPFKQGLILKLCRAQSSVTVLIQIVELFVTLGRTSLGFLGKKDGRQEHGQSE